MDVGYQVCQKNWYGRSLPLDKIRGTAIWIDNITSAAENFRWPDGGDGEKTFMEKQEDIPQITPAGSGREIQSTLLGRKLVFEKKNMEEWVEIFLP